MKLHRIRYFVSSVELGSFAAAARALNIAQPALSQQIGELEHTVGVPLLLRNFRGVTPTEAGEFFYKHAVIILRQLESAIEETQSLGKIISGDVSLILSTTMAQIYLPKLINVTLDSYPKVKLHINQDVNGIDFVSALKNGRADFAIMPEIRKIPELYTTVLSEHPLFLVGTNESLSAIEGFDGTFNFKDVNLLPLVLPQKRHPYRAKIEKFATEHGIELNIQAEPGEAAIVTKYVETGKFFTILPEKSFTSGTGACDLRGALIVRPNLIGRSILYRHSKRQLSSSAQAVVELILKIFCA